jgi:hypothetical protein
LELEHIIERALLQVDGRISVGDIRGLLNDSGLDDGEGAESPVTIH